MAEPSYLYLRLEPWLRAVAAWLREPAGYASVAIGTGAVACIAVGLLQLATPPDRALSPDAREIPGAIQHAIARVVAQPQPESGYPRVVVPRVHIDLLLVKGTGLTPPDVYEAFTYPGADHLLDGEMGKGNSYVYAHAQNGMFWNLHNVRVGDLVEIDYGGGRELYYRVSEVHPSVDYRDFSWLQPTSDDRLTLQTCNGWRDEDPRFIVVAERVGGPSEASA